MPAILYSEVNALCIAILLLIFVRTRHSTFLQSHRRLFSNVVLSNVFFFLLDLIWVLNDGSIFSISYSMNWIVNILYYIFSALVSFLWFLYSETLQKSSLVQDKKYRAVIAAPFILLTLLTLLSYKTNWLFYIDEMNRYNRGALYFLQVILSYGYIIFTAAKALYHSLKTSNPHDRTAYRTLVMFVIPSLVTGFIQTFVPGVPLLCIGTTFGILYVFINMQEQLISVDPLTHLNNRNQLNQYLFTKLHHPNAEKALYLLIMDIDYFKKINDKYGHVEGDRALVLVANSLMTACKSDGFFLSRYGGDEFIVICELDQSKSIEQVCSSIHKHLGKIETPYSLTVSIGYAKYTSDIKSDQDLIATADAELYKMKKTRK